MHNHFIELSLVTLIDAGGQTGGPDVICVTE